MWTVSGSWSRSWQAVTSSVMLTSSQDGMNLVPRGLPSGTPVFCIARCFTIAPLHLCEAETVAGRVNQGIKGVAIRYTRVLHHTSLQNLQFCISGADSVAERVESGRKGAASRCNSRFIHALLHLCNAASA